MEVLTNPAIEASTLLAVEMKTRTGAGYELRRVVRRQRPHAQPKLTSSAAARFGIRRQIVRRFRCQFAQRSLHLLLLAIA
jgi:hypothetical protein